MINVIGLGYIGLPTALMLSNGGNQVVGTDINTCLVEKLKNRKGTFEEEGLEKELERAFDKGIRFQTNYSSTDFYIVTVPTPYNKETKEIDPSYVIEAVQGILRVCKKDTIIVIESTVSPGTIKKHIKPLIAESQWELNKDIFLAHAPERIIPGKMFFELVHNPRTIGADLPIIAEKVANIYSSFCKGKITKTTIDTAEMTKVVENTYRAVNIAFANELLKIADFNQLDTKEIIEICNQHPRVNILSPGPGVGGHCIPVDPWFLVGDFPRMTKLTATALEINESMPDYVMKRINTIMKKEDIHEPNRIGIYGLSYKQDVDDIRESPTLQLFEKMSEFHAMPFKSFDPMVKRRILENQVVDFNEFIDSVDMVVVMVGHKHILENIDKLKGKIILDTQGILNTGYTL